MLKIRIIPCLDVKDGRVVKGVNFVDLKDAGDPVEAAAAYDAAGADELCFLDITASHENRDTIFDIVERTAVALLHAADRGRRRAHHRGHPQAAARGRRQGVDQHRRRAPPAVRGRGRRQVRRAVHRRRHRRQAGVAAGRAAALGAVHPRRAQADRARGRRLCARGGGARRRRDPAHLHGPRRHQGRLRPGADARHRRCRVACR